MNKGMSIIVKNIARIICGMAFLFGLYIVAHGHLSPGGGFAGGVILALVYVLTVLAFGKTKEQKEKSKTRTTLVECLGAIMFLSLALLGFFGGNFFQNFVAKGSAGQLASAGLIPWSNLAIMLKVSAGLFAVFLVLVSIKIDINQDDE